MTSPSDLDTLCVNTIRSLSIDAVQQAKSGHPGTPMALAPMAYVLWNRVLRFDPRDPIWPGRDRFVLSNGHASMLLWSLLHISGTRAVNAAYERLVRKFRPERHREPERKKAAEKLLVRLETARDGLKAYARRRS